MQMIQILLACLLLLSLSVVAVVVGGGDGPLLVLVALLVALLSVLVVVVVESEVETCLHIEQLCNISFHDLHMTNDISQATLFGTGHNFGTLLTNVKFYIEKLVVRLVMHLEFCCTELLYHM